MDYKRMCFYQIYPRSFCDSDGDGIGDIKGIISKLDYIASLGVDGIWFSPLYSSPNSDYGYDISNYREINAEYGTMADFDELLTEMHKRDLKCIMDLVVNHTSSLHKWFLHSASSKDNAYRDYYFWRKGRGKEGKKPPNNWTSFFTGSAWKYDERTQEWYLHLFDENQPDLNYSNPKVKEEIKDILRFWLDKGVDGFRCDVVTIMKKTPGLPDGKGFLALVGKEHYIDNIGMPELLKEFRDDVLSRYDTFTVGESVMITVEKALMYIDERDMALNTVFAFDHMAADNYFGIKQLVRKFNLNILKKSNERWQRGLYGKGWNANYLENHDQARIVGRFCSDEKEYREKGAKMLANVLFFLSGTPFVYEGQEIGMTSIKMTELEGYKDVETYRTYRLMRKLGFSHKKTMKAIAYCSRDNARTPMQWNESANGGFSKAETTWLPLNPNYREINVQSQLKDPNSILNYHKKLIQLRKTHDEMIFGTYTLLNIGGRKLYAYLREYKDKALLVISNFTKKNYNFKAPRFGNAKTKLFVSNYDDSPQTLGDCVLRPYESVVYSLSKD